MMGWLNGLDCTVFSGKDVAAGKVFQTAAVPNAVQGRNFNRAVQTRAINPHAV